MLTRILPLIFLFDFMSPLSIHAQSDLLINVYNRNSISLNGEWNYIVDPYETGFYNYRSEPYDKFHDPGNGAYFMNAKPKDKTELIEYDFDRSDKINVPGDWNTQKEKLFYYEGTIWYKKSFDYTKLKNDSRVFLYFDAVNYQSDVYLNGQKLGTHTGGFTPFNFEITDIVKPKDNFLIVKVDNKRKREGVPTLNTDWWNYGGITRDVRIFETPQTFIQDYFIQLNPDDKNQIKGYIHLKGTDNIKERINMSIPELNLEKELITNIDGFASFQTHADNIKYWSTTNPHLYKIIIKTNEEEIIDYIGFRSIKTDGQDILLNDEKIFLKGICFHEEKPLQAGRAYSQDDAKQLLTWVKELGCNYVRLAHYPHNENMIRLADKMGILVWEEVPVYWTIDWENEETYENAQNQLSEVICRDKNRASVIIWSMANETPVGSARNNFLMRLIDYTRKLDNTRLISAALEQSNYDGDPFIKTITDPLADMVDVLSFNQYIGWYDGLPDKCKNISWKIKQDKPAIISEFGGGAKYGFHGDSLTRWSEEYQEYLYAETLKMIGKIPQLRGISPWILADFRSPRRNLPDIQDGWNRKGLISSEGYKKKAFYVLKEFYESLSGR
jgi:beta-glucuronidase